MKLCRPRIFVIGRANREERKANFSFSREIEWTNHVSVLCSPGKPMKKTPVSGFPRALLSYPQSCAKQKIGLTFHRRIQRKVNQWKRKGASAIKIIWSCSKFPAAAVCKKSLPFCTLCFHIRKFAKDFASTQNISQTKKCSTIAVIRADNCNNCSENCELTEVRLP